ncbi:YncE family protein [Streptomyces sp. NBC_01754]|uniref:YncE family protein n=1 Tax=Streptomyces sp. NBC_01754 TaxID=2975930 RepID=UPI002DDAC79D|nr:YncE family protein [Streptomyces sp. NBC_01754]WSC91146.1 YncE family protein [Streptomyces sp. NBC_01754]
MTLSDRRVHGTTTGTAAPTAVGALTPAGTATTDPGTTSRLSVTSATLAAGLYQSAYSERHGTLWATVALGGPPEPVTESRLLRIDPATLEVEASFDAPLDDATGTIEAVYGIDVDDEHDTVWVTHTRDDSVSVYSQRTGRCLATRSGVAHPREVVVDEKRGTVWATAFGSGEIVGFDSRTFEETARVTVEGSGPTGLAVDGRTSTVYACDFTHDRVIQVRPGSRTPRLLPTGRGPLSVALSPDGRTAYTADQGTGTLSAVDLREGVVTRTIHTGEGAKSLATEPGSGQVLVVNRLAGTLSVVDPRTGTLLRNVATGALPNHVRVHDRSAYVLDKSASGPAGEDRITRIPLGPG